MDKSQSRQELLGSPRNTNVLGLEESLNDDSVVKEEDLQDDDDEPNIEDFLKEEEEEQGLHATDGKILFSHNSKFIKNWNNGVIILAMYNSITIPMAIFYGDDGPSIL